MDAPEWITAMYTKQRNLADLMDLSDAYLVVDIFDVATKRDKVQFAVCTKTTLPEFRKQEFSVVREHQDFIWLREKLLENQIYSATVIPPEPPFPDFVSSRSKMQLLRKSKSLMSQEDFEKSNQLLTSDYMALFDHTVAVHEAFLKQLAGHQDLRTDVHFRIFLELEGELDCDVKSKSGNFNFITKHFRKSSRRDQKAVRRRCSSLLNRSDITDDGTRSGFNSQVDKTKAFLKTLATVVGIVALGALRLAIRR